MSVEQESQQFFTETTENIGETSELIIETTEKIANSTQSTDPKEDKRPTAYVPAPLPVASAWKAVTNDIPVQTISINAVKKSKNEKNKNSGTAIKSNSSTKWVPITPSIVVSDAKKLGNNKKKTTTNGNESTQKNNKKKLKSISLQNGKKSDENGNKKSDELETTNDNNRNQETKKPHQQKKSIHNNNNSQRKRNQHDGHNQNVNYSQQRTNYNIHYNSHQVYQPYYSIQPILLAINNVAKQLEYYFSKENLEKDTFLRGNLSKEGYVPLSLLAKFYRVVSMSFGGDVNVILAALSEIVANENTSVEVSAGMIENPTEEEDGSLLSRYLIRSKDWSSYPNNATVLSVIVEKQLLAIDLEQFRISVPSLASQFHPQQQNIEQDVKQKEQTKEDK